MLLAMGDRKIMELICTLFLIRKPFQQISFFDSPENIFRINIKAAENATSGIRDVFVETDTYLYGSRLLYSR